LRRAGNGKSTVTSATAFPGKRKVIVD